MIEMMVLDASDLKELLKRLWYLDNIEGENTFPSEEDAVTHDTTVRLIGKIEMLELIANKARKGAVNG